MHFATGARLQPDGARSSQPVAALLDRRGLSHAAPQRVDSPSFGSQRQLQLRSLGRQQTLSTPVTVTATRAYAAVASSAPEELRKGALVEVKKQHRSLLVVLSRLEGKQKCYGLDKVSTHAPDARQM